MKHQQEREIACSVAAYLHADLSEMPRDREAPAPFALRDDRADLSTFLRCESFEVKPDVVPLLQFVWKRLCTDVSPCLLAVGYSDTIGILYVDPEAEFPVVSGRVTIPMSAFRMIPPAQPVQLWSDWMDAGT